MRTFRTLTAIAAVAVLATACGGGSDDGGDAGGVEGTVVGAGSSTVLPVADIILEEYAAAQPGVDASYTSIGSGGGFERLCDLGDVDFSGASRQIRDEEAALCEENGYPIVELQFGVDALTMVTSPETDWVDCLSTEQIVQIFGPEGGNALTWDQVVDGAPAEALDIYAPDTDSGTYGFMVEDIMDLEESTQDYAASSDDNVIVQGIESGAGTWGYFGLAYFEANAADLKAIAHENSETGACVLPSVETAQDGSYELVRPLYIYVRSDTLAESPALADFATFFLDNANAAIDVVGYVKDEATLDASTSTLSDAIG